MFDPCIGNIPWRRAQQPTPVFLPGESHGQRSLVGYSLEGSKESDRTKVTKHARMQSFQIIPILQNLPYACLFKEI